MSYGVVGGLVSGFFDSGLYGFGTKRLFSKIAILEKKSSFLLTVFGGNDVVVVIGAERVKCPIARISWKKSNEWTKLVARW